MDRYVSFDEELILTPSSSAKHFIDAIFTLTVDDDRSRGSILVDRRVLIALQWFSNTIMVFSLLASLLSRKFKLVKTIPADFHFFGGPTPVINNDMRYVTSCFGQ